MHVPVGQVDAGGAGCLARVALCDHVLRRGRGRGRAALRRQDGGLPVAARSRLRGGDAAAVTAALVCAAVRERLHAARLALSGALYDGRGAAVQLRPGRRQDPHADGRVDSGRPHQRLDAHADGHRLHERLGRSDGRRGRRSHVRRGHVRRHVDHVRDARLPRAERRAAAGARAAQRLRVAGRRARGARRARRRCRHRARQREQRRRRRLGRGRRAADDQRRRLRRRRVTHGRQPPLRRHRGGGLLGDHERRRRACLRDERNLRSGDRRRERPRRADRVSRRDAVRGGGRDARGRLRAADGRRVDDAHVDRPPCRLGSGRHDALPRRHQPRRL